MKKWTEQLKSEPFGCTPIRWAKVHLIRRLVTSMLPLTGRPILLLSLPRSGSSWIGSILGDSPQTLYMREPLTEVLLRREKLYDKAESDVHDPAVWQVLNDTAAYVFAGIPVFPSNVVTPRRGRQTTGDWALRNRSTRRLVVKEVNPLFLKPIAKAFNPFVVFIVRHPAAIAESYYRLKWTRTTKFKRADFDQSVFGGGYENALDWIEAIDDFWTVSGFRQGLLLNHALQILSGQIDHVLVSYEELCLEPIRECRRVFAACGLEWPLELDSIVHDTSSVHEEGDYSRLRISANMVGAWRSKISPDALSRVRKGYYATQCCLYDKDEDW